MRDTIIKMWKHKWIVLACIIICAGIGAVLGYRNGQREQANLSVEYEKLVNSAQTEYDSKIAEYDKNINNAELEVDKAQKALDTVEDFINNSVYMKLDSNNIATQIATVEIEPSEEIDANKEASKLGLYVTSGAILSDIDESLGAKYWTNTIGVSVAGNDICISIMQADEATAKKAMEAIIDALENYANINLITVSNRTLITSNVDVGYQQITHRNNYYSYKQNLNNQKKTLMDQENGKATYETSGVEAIIEAKVKAADKMYFINPIKKAFLTSIIGALIGFILPMAIILIIGIINDDKKRTD